MSSAKSTQAVILLLVGLAALLASRPADAQTETVLYNFTKNADNGSVGTPVVDKAGNIYGTVGIPWGVVYKPSPGKNGKWKETAIHSFGGIVADHDGYSPAGALVVDAAGDLYGAMTQGGIYNSEGTVFELVAPVGDGKYEHEVLWNFGAFGDGIYPIGGLIRDDAGNLWGTASEGGSDIRLRIRRHCVQSDSVGCRSISRILTI
jgi:hypothetical protein